MTFKKVSLPGYASRVLSSINDKFDNIWYVFFQGLWLRSGGNSGIPQLRSFTVSTLPTASSLTGALIYVSDETGGAVPAFSDGTNWRRVTDRAIVS